MIKHCSFCNSDICRDLSRFKGSTQFCNSDCKRNYRNKIHMEALIPITCEYCQKVVLKHDKKRSCFKTEQGFINRYRYCSKTCMYAANPMPWRKYNNPTKSIQTFTCKFCNNNFTVRGGTWIKRKFCSKKCRHQHRFQNEHIIITCKKCNKTTTKKKIFHTARTPQGYEDYYNYCSRKCAYPDRVEKGIDYRKFRQGQTCQVTCKGCNELFTITLVERYNRAPRYCSTKCRRKHYWITLTCSHCNRQFDRLKSHYNRNITHNKPQFCSKDCRIKGINLHRLPKSRSAFEIFVENRIKYDFPQLDCKFNDRKTIKDVNGIYRELDIYLPTHKIGIELNGPHHYRPIYGQKVFEATQYRDTTKRNAYNQYDIKIYEFDTSSIYNNATTERGYQKEYERFYTTKIKPLLSTPYKYRYMQPAHQKDNTDLRVLYETVYKDPFNPDNTSTNNSQESFDQYLDDNGESEEGCKAIGTTIAKLAAQQVGTVCGAKNNQTFQALNQAGFGNKKVVGWYHLQDHQIWGMVHIEATPEEAEQIEKIAEQAHGSLRYDTQSARLPGYQVFEIE